MPVYRYTATDLSKKTQTGEIAADSEAKALQLLSLRSLTAVSLFEQAPPAPPMPLGKKLAVVVAAMTLLGVTAFVAHRAMSVPPDMKKVYQEWDQAVEDGDVTRQFVHFDETYRIETKDGAKPVKREVLERFVKSSRGSEKLVRKQTTAILDVQQKGSQCEVTISQTSFVGKPGVLSSQTVARKFVHRWQRQGRAWKIVQLKQIDPQ